MLRYWLRSCCEISCSFPISPAIIIAITSLVGSVFYGHGINSDFGIESIIIFPILYGIIGLILGIIMAAIYNFVAGITGGLEIEVEND